MGNSESVQKGAETGASAAAGAIISKVSGRGGDDDKKKKKRSSSSSSSEDDKDERDHRRRRRHRRQRGEPVPSSHLRRRRENYRQDLADEKARAKVRADKAGCCGDGNASSDSDDEVPYDPGSEYSDANYYVSSTGERHRRRPRPYGSDGSSSSGESGGERRREPLGDPVVQRGEGSTTAAAAAVSSEPQSTLIPMVVVPPPQHQQPPLLDRLQTALEAMEYRQRLLVMDSMDDEWRLLLSLAQASVECIKRNELAAAACGLLFTSHLPLKNQAAIVHHVHRVVHPAASEASPLNSPKVRTSFPKMPLDHGGLVFDLGGMQLGDDSAYLAARTLRAPHTAALLTHVLLPSSALTDHGVDVLCAAFDAADPPFWQFLDVSGNAITMKGALRFVATLEALYPAGRPSKFRREVSLDANDHIWMVATAHRVALMQRCDRLQACNVFVTLPPKPADD